MMHDLNTKNSFGGINPHPKTNMKKQLLLVLHAPPLPLNQGYRHAAYNDIIQLSRLHDLHILICNGQELVYDFTPDSYELNQKKLFSIPGVKSVSFIELNVDWWKPLRQRLLRQAKVLLRKGRLMEDSSADKLTLKIIELCRAYGIRDIHLGITINLFIDVFLNLRKLNNYMISFTAHDIDADKILTRMRENFAQKNYIKVLTNWLTYWILLWKEIRACRMSRLVISMAYRDFERLSQKKVKVFFIPPYLHVLKTERTPNMPASKPTLVILGHLAFSAAGHGVELFLEQAAVKIKEAAPAAAIKIIGKDASPFIISKCKQLGIFYREYVEDLEELWEQTTVVASPLLVSKGIRIRILEAACRGIPVVCTEQSATGFEKPGEFLRVTNDFDLFADHCIELLTNTKKYQLEQQRIYEYYKRNLAEDKIRLLWEQVWSVNHNDISLLSSLQEHDEMITGEKKEK